uniref:Uncharacterized protein n=1 Tax=Leersia perrieri TaxID=77586 RepID=A0A0D9X723_9ORYZ
MVQGTGITCFIKIVGDRLRVDAPDQYTPNIVSIGPYHRNPHLGREEKIGILDRIVEEKAVQRSHPIYPSDLKSEWLSRLSNYLEGAMDYYGYDPEIPNSFTMSREDFLNMLLEDGCYILHKFVAARANSQEDQQDLSLVHDVIYLAENQIPFFILKNIYEIIGQTDSLVGFFCSYIKEKVLKPRGYAIGDRCSELPNPSHLLHLLHILLIGDQLATDTRSETVIQVNARDVPNPMAGEKSISHFRRWRRAKQYDAAGVDFTGVDLISIIESSGHGALPERSILDVRPIRRCRIGLEFPSLKADNETFCMLRNLIALEQGNPITLSHHVTAYCMLMSQLACKEEDVELLIQRCAVDHLMANDAKCADSFADLCNGVTFDLDDPSLNYLRDECVQLDRRYRSRPSKWTAWMLREYCRNPCVAVGSVLALIVIAFGLLQAVYTVLKITGKVK